MQHSVCKEADSSSANEDIFLQNGTRSLIPVLTRALYVSLS